METWVLFAGIALLLLFILIAGRRYGPGGTRNWYGPGGTRNWYGPGGTHMYGPGGTRHLYGPGGTRDWVSPGVTHMYGPVGTHLFGPDGTHLLGPGGVEGFSSSMMPTLYMFGWKDCGHCKTAKPEFEKFKATIGDRVHCQYIEGPENPEMAKEYGVEGYPTFWFVNGAKKMKYEGERTAEALQRFCEENM
jgi:thiol-disulfide isomerase/thioredoxin